MMAKVLNYFRCFEKPGRAIANGHARPRPRGDNAESVQVPLAEQQTTVRGCECVPLLPPASSLLTAIFKQILKLQKRNDSFLLPCVIQTLCRSFRSHVHMYKYMQM